MWVKRKKKRNDAPLKENTLNTLDALDRGVDFVGSVPIVDKASERWRNRITGYTKPLKKMIKNPE